MANREGTKADIREACFAQEATNLSLSAMAS